MKTASIIVACCFLVQVSFAQLKDSSLHRIFLTTGFGASGSFHVRDYDEVPPFAIPGYQAFLKKDFIGTAQEFAVGIHLKRNVDLKIGYNRQRNTRHVIVDDTLNGTGVFLDHQIQNVDHSFFIGMNKAYPAKKHQLLWGAGLYIWSNYDHQVEIYSNFVIDREFRIVDFKKDGDLGAYAEF